MTITKEKWIYFLILLNPIFEIVYSILYRLDIKLPLNQMFRFMMLCCFVLFTKSAKTKKIVVILATTYLSIWITQLLAGYSRVSFGEMSFIFKIIYSTCLIFIFIDYIKNNIVNTNTLIRITIYSSFIIIISICVSPLGLGYEAWTGTAYRTGYVGWFLFGNYLTIVLLIVFCLLIYTDKIQGRRLWIALTALAIVLLGNKAGLVSLIVYFTTFGFIYFFGSQLTKKKLLFILVIGMCILSVTPTIIGYLDNFIRNQIKLYSAYRYTNIFSFLLSNRDLQIFYVERDLNGNNKCLESLIGYGYGRIIDILKPYRFEAIEMDLYALRYYLGYIPVCIWFGIFLKVMLCALKRFFKDRDLKSTTILLGVGVAITHSIFTGHIIFESLSIVYFAILGAICVTRTAEN
ncbi:MAG: hypothetical protein HFH97_04540 [Lachnospiraceae bacterium]|jgi:hypothetical protein|nr:O-antigen ligase family protein [uncultured Acetatifactor sp.]MCI9571869.1 hypothetical protein [Lachnospiraceae bacterium]